MSHFWDLIWLMFSAFVFVAYLFVMFQIVADLFRDGELGGFGKAAWIVGLILLPFLTALVYVVARGRGMARRQQAAAQRVQSEAETYIRQVVLDDGTITADEFARLKAKALG